MKIKIKIMNGDKNDGILFTSPAFYCGWDVDDLIAFGFVVLCFDLKVWIPR